MKLINTQTFFRLLIINKYQSHLIKKNEQPHQNNYSQISFTIDNAFSVLGKPI